MLICIHDTAKMLAETIKLLITISVSQKFLDQTKCPYLVRIWKNTVRKNSVFGFFCVVESLSSLPKAYSESCQTTKMGRFAKIVNDFQPCKLLLQNTSSEIFGRNLNTPLISFSQTLTTKKKILCQSLKIIKQKLKATQYKPVLEI